MEDWKLRADWQSIPASMRGQIERYVDHGVDPGSFLEAVFSNDLKGVFGQVDQWNKEHIANYVSFMYRFMPALSQGSPKDFQHWLEIGGLIGLTTVGQESYAERMEKEAARILNEPSDSSQQ